MPEILIRAATHSDLPGLLDIFNDVIATSTAVFFLDPVTLDERRTWFEARRRAGFPVLVADRDGEVVGFASFGEFRGAWHGYRYSVEHSVHIRRDCRGQGLGPQLVTALYDPARALQKHVMVGGIDATNDASLRMHDKLGFERVAHFKEVGHKFGRWLDLIFVQRFVDEAGTKR